MSLRDDLKKIQEELIKKNEARQEIQTAMRKATRMSKQAIFLVHRDEIEEAEKMLREAEMILAHLPSLSRNNSDLLYMGSVDAAFEEYAEARIFLGLVKEGRFVGLEEVNVPMASYVLGLADVIGELRRRALDSIRKTETEEAEKCLRTMETIYMELINLDEIQLLVSGLRRKCDVARRLIELTRGEITIDVRRSLLEKSIRELKKMLEADRRE